MTPNCPKSLSLGHLFIAHIKTQHFRPSSSGGGSLTKPVAFLLIFDSLLGFGLISTLGGASGSSGSSGGTSVASGSASFLSDSEISLKMISMGGSSTALNSSSGLQWWKGSKNTCYNSANECECVIIWYTDYLPLDTQQCLIQLMIVMRQRPRLTVMPQVPPSLAHSVPSSDLRTQHWTLSKQRGKPMKVPSFFTLFSSHTSPRQALGSLRR